jgi:PLD-like domain
MDTVIAEDGSQRQHRQLLRNLLETSEGPVRIATAYITERDLLLGITTRNVRILTSLLRMDIVSGATSLESLRSLIEMGVQCRCMSDGPRLHAKVYMFGEETAVVTSANLTRSALDSNIEVGVQLTGSAIHELTIWFDSFWAKARPLDVMQVSRWQELTVGLRRDYWDLRKKASAGPTLPNEAPPVGESPDELRALLDNAKRYFFCNTDRRQGERTPSGGYLLEERMHRRGYAAAWESFIYPTHMKKVERGDAIFMFAKGVGIIGIGCAKGKLQILEPSESDRIRKFDYEEITREWRVPVDWLDWRDDGDACLRKGLNGTFLDVTEDQHSDLREAVRSHFLGKL